MRNAKRGGAMTFEEIASVEGITRQRAQQIYTRALLKLGRALAQSGLGGRLRGESGRDFEAYSPAASIHVGRTE